MQVIFEKKLRICVDMLYFSVQPATGTTLYRKEEIRGAERKSHLAGENGIACYAHSKMPTTAESHPLILYNMTFC
ncbi:hypothetical protein D3Z60_09480 [Lachnospiraceae bacterium]|jgi:hypothetical protein|nr:hypothetical protein [Lachnospiraceae bacterium]